MPDGGVRWMREWERIISPLSSASSVARRTHKHTRGGRDGKRALAFRLRLAVCLSASENGAAAGLGALPLGVVFCCCGGLLVLVFNKPCASALR